MFPELTQKNFFGRNLKKITITERDGGRERTIHSRYSSEIT